MDRHTGEGREGRGVMACEDYSRCKGLLLVQSSMLLLRRTIDPYCTTENN